MNSMIDAFKKANLISTKKAEWAERQAGKIDKISKRLAREGMEAKEARNMAIMVNDAEVKKKERDLYKSRQAKRKANKKK